MNSLYMKINELKDNLIKINLRYIKKNKVKPIKPNHKNLEEYHLIEEYNYYVKLIKRLKRYIEFNSSREMILKTSNDKFQNIIYIATSIEKKKIDIGLNIEINIITGNECSAFLDCTYYNTSLGGKLYLNDFKSSKPKLGYGSIILKNLDKMVYLTNEILYKMGYEEIRVLEGVMIPSKNIISEEELRKLYIKHNFNIDKKNNIWRFIDTNR